MPEGVVRAALTLMLATAAIASSTASAAAAPRVFAIPESAKLVLSPEPDAGDGTVTSACTALADRPDCTSGELLAACAARLEEDPSWCSSYIFGLSDRDRGWLEGVQRNTPPSVAAHRRPTDRPAPPPRRTPRRTSKRPADVAPVPAATGATGVDAATDASVSSGTGRDLLMNNGLVSPWCISKRTFSAAAARNCAASGSTATSAAADNVGFDTHIDTATALGLPKPAQTFSSIVAMLMQLAWAFFLAVTRGIFWLVELALSFNPLQAIGGQRALALLSAEVSAITRPLAMFLAPAGAVWIIAQFGWARRQGEALKHAFVSTLLIAASVVVLSNPVGTVGALLVTSQQVGLGIIGAVVAPVTGTSPTNGAAGAQAGLRALSDGLIEQPLSLLEFGDVDFGTDPAQLDDELRAAAVRLASEDREKLLAVKEARTNLDLFEVWPAGSAARNAINDEGSLLRVLCGNDDATDCKGPHAAQAEFRTEKGTWQHAIALLVIAAGLIPVWIALLFTSFKLLEAGVMCLIRLCQLVFVTPLAVLGKEGNERVIRYAGGFTGNLLASTAYSAFLALIFLLWVLLTRFGTLGFVGQWLLLAVVLWLLVRHHDSLWGAARSHDGHMRSRGMQAAQMMLGYRVARGVGSVGRSGRRGAINVARGGRRASQGRLSRGGAAHHAPPGRGRDALGKNVKPSVKDAADARTAGLADASVTPAGTNGGGGASAAPARAGAALTPNLLGGGKPAAWARLRGQHKAIGGARSRHATAILSMSFKPDLQERRDRIGSELAGVAAQVPSATGSQRQRLMRRGASLAQRAQRLDGHLGQFARAQRVAEEIVPPKQRAAREARFLDTQSKLRRGRAPSPARVSEHRNYAQLAGLIGQTPRDYGGSSAQAQLRARARIDRELAQRSKDRREVRRPAVRAVPGTVAPPDSAAGQEAARNGRRSGKPVAGTHRRRAPTSSR